MFHVRLTTMSVGTGAAPQTQSQALRPAARALSTVRRSIVTQSNPARENVACFARADNNRGVISTDAPCWSVISCIRLFGDKHFRSIKHQEKTMKIRLLFTLAALAIGLATPVLAQLKDTVDPKVR